MFLLYIRACLIQLFYFYSCSMSRLNSDDFSNPFQIEKSSALCLDILLLTFRKKLNIEQWRKCQLFENIRRKSSENFRAKLWNAFMKWCIRKYLSVTHGPCVMYELTRILDFRMNEKWNIFWMGQSYFGVHIR